MAAYLSLRHKETGAIFAGADLIKVDEMLCAALGVEPDPVSWHMGWMDWIGFSIAVRSDKSVADALSHHMVPSQFGDPDPDSLAICNWFIASFDGESYHQHR